MNTPSPSNEPIQQPKLYPGQHLAATRQERGWSQEQVAAKLHLRVQVIDLLEQDHYESLPESVFVQGYIKAYAKLLHIDSAPLIESYDVIKGPEKNSERILRQRKKEPKFRSYKTMWTLIGSSMVVVMLMTLGLNKRHDDVDAVAASTVQTQNTVDLVPDASAASSLAQVESVAPAVVADQAIESQVEQPNKTIEVQKNNAPKSKTTPKTTPKIAQAKTPVDKNEEHDDDDDAESDDE